MREFNPERWLVKNEKTGKVDFDPRAAPMQIFGAGVRSCYGLWTVTKAIVSGWTD